MKLQQQKSLLISIGQFSDLTRLSIKALRLYDAKEMLNPAYVDEETGYRYYKIEQSKDAKLIKALRAVDMSLDQIQEVLNAPNIESKLEIFKSQQANLQLKVQQQQQMLAHLESLIDIEEQAMTIQANIVELDSVGIAGFRFTTDLEKIKADVPNGFAKLGQMIGRGVLKPLGAPFIIYHDVIDEESNGDVEICVPTGNDFEEQSGVAFRELEGGMFASSVHKGPYEKIGPVYQSLPQWVYENGFEIVGPPREVYENDPREIVQDELLTRVLFPVCKQTGEVK